MELYHNQVTRVQGPFSLRMFHRSWGLMLIQANIEAPCTLLDFPTLDRFIEEIRHNHYDIVGISSIIPNVLKVRKMCELVRRYQPRRHDRRRRPHRQRARPRRANRRRPHRQGRRRPLVPRASWARTQDQPIRHPQIPSGIGTRNMGITLKEKPGDVAATLIPSVGCPMGCNFCSTSAMFGGKGKFVNFYETGDELFDVMCQLEAVDAASSRSS